MTFFLTDDHDLLPADMAEHSNNGSIIAKAPVSVKLAGILDHIVEIVA